MFVRRVRHVRRSAPAAAAAALALLAACAAGSGAPRTHVVEMRGFAFVPERVEVAVGDTVVWINRDVVPHTATGKDAEWNSGSIASQQRWSLVPSDTGTFAYICTFHPTMTGTLVVRP
ncbi:MAG TPA: cupredoxin family copper-binding protein [Gemmatimonadaceae bacterium]